MSKMGSSGNPDLFIWIRNTKLCVMLVVIIRLVIILKMVIVLNLNDGSGHHIVDDRQTTHINNMSISTTMTGNIFWYLDKKVDP